MDTSKLDASGLGQLADDEPHRHDIFIGLVSPIGSNRLDVVKHLTDILKGYGYTIQVVRLAEQLQHVPVIGEGLPDRSDPRYYKELMDAGDTLRKYDGSALAAAAISQVAYLRNEAVRSRPKAVDQQPTIFVFDSLKHPREAELLRVVYGSAFWLVSIVQDMDERLKDLAEQLAKQAGQFEVPGARALELINRDEADPDAKHGQHVRDVFADADYFLAVQRGTRWREGIVRLCQGIFGAPFLTPRPDEEAMRYAQAAALRSAAVGRQVGAAVVTRLGSPIIVGTNEVPRPGGGQFWSGDEPDHRDFQTGEDPNPAYTRRLITELLDRFATAGFFTDDRNAAGGEAVLQEASRPDENGKSILEGARADSLIEFTRCLHAEQAAIVNAARAGISLDGSRLFTTTFPCHECTKFIIGAGVIEVQYIDPYPKSLAADLYRDLVDTLPPIQVGKPGSTLSKVPFRAFVGFGPRRYDEVFTAPRRKLNTSLAEHVPAEACPIGGGWNGLAVQSREDQVVVAYADTLRRVAERAEEVASAKDQADATVPNAQADGPQAQTGTGRE